ncbi:MAG TPA: hypothetical protein VKS60_00600 [Stellaceae bacterium]|nr:hypothetical protein [Stellaceae bacterium]
MNVAMVLNLLAAAAGLVAAWWWYKASEVPSQPLSAFFGQGKSGDELEQARDHTAGLAFAATRSAASNKVAAIWTATSVLLSAPA